MADSQVHIIAVVKAIKDNRPNRLCSKYQSLSVMIKVDVVYTGTYLQLLAHSEPL